ncbi:MAG: RdgB/HAM1 family non-canonical purine NTP pyrophosphatase [Oscillospiraceae bacterium]|nr:RdgB/HAM1 family non-canonical purine NTP pyrophosphatase [Oscillospiraceae bacterium]
MRKFLIASNNQHKVQELNRILNPLGINAVTAKKCNVDLGDVEETGSTFAENAEIKALAAFDRTKMPSVADDSGLVVDALDGRPGVYSARYGGVNATDEDKYNKILEEMKNVPESERTARFVSSICLILEDGTKIQVEGTSEGKIAYEPKGTEGFGYDPIFVTQNGKTFAELTPGEKDAVSHRGKALIKLKDELTKIL